MSIAPITVRPAVVSEQALLKAMIRAGRLNPLGLDWCRFLVAVSGSGEVVGCIQRKDHTGDVRELASLYVLPEWRGRGVASQLIRQLIERASPPLWLTCRSSLSPFYSQFGFAVIDDPQEMPSYFRFAALLFRILRVFLSRGDRLTVMCNTATGTQKDTSER